MNTREFQTSRGWISGRGFFTSSEIWPLPACGTGFSCYTSSAADDWLALVRADHLLVGGLCMGIQKFLLGLMTSLALSCAAFAAPPVSPLSEGRELDPVARDHYLHPCESTLADADRSCEQYTAEGSLFSILRGLLLREATMPLGTANLNRSNW